MRTTYQEAEAVRSDYAEGFVVNHIPSFKDCEVADLALDYMQALALLEQIAKTYDETPGARRFRERTYWLLLNAGLLR